MNDGGAPKVGPATALDEIAREGQDLLGGAPGGPAADPGAPGAPVTDAQAIEREGSEWASLPYLFGKIVCKAMPELLPAFSDEHCAEWGRAMVPVARKHGWTFSGACVYAALAGATWNFAEPTYEAVKARRAQAKAPAGDKPAARVSDGKDRSPGPGSVLDPPAADK